MSSRGQGDRNPRGESTCALASEARPRHRHGESMFATLAAGYPRPDLPSDAPGDDVVRAVVADLAASGLEILSDGGVRRDDPLGGIASLLQGFEIGPAT